MMVRLNTAAVVCFALLLGLIGCGDEGDHGPIDARLDEPALEKAREVEAEKYAPDTYERAVDRGDEALARRALSEALEVKEEARQAAEAGIRDAEVLLEVVEKLTGPDDPNRQNLPTSEELSKLRDELARARRAFENGDFPTAGLMAQAVTESLEGPAT